MSPADPGSLPPMLAYKEKSHFKDKQMATPLAVWLTIDIYNDLSQ